MTRRGLVARALCVGALLGATSAAAEPVPRCVVVDVGGHEAAAPLRAAVEVAVAAARRVRPHPDAALRAALRGEEASAGRLQPARAALAAAAAAYGALKCEATLAQAARAVDLLEAEVGAAPVRGDLQRALVYLLLCRDSRGDVAGAAEAAAQLRGLGTAAASGPAPGGGVAPAAADAPPPGVPRDVWQRYPEPPAGGATHTVEIRSEPPGAHVLVDLRPVGITPVTLSVGAGRHQFVVFRPGVIWRRQVEVASSGVVYDVALAPGPPDPLEALRAQALALHKKPTGERLAAAVRLGRETGAERLLAIDANAGRLRAQLYDTASGLARGGRFDEDARTLATRPADLTVFLDGAGAATAAPATAPASRPAATVKLGSKWWHWVVGAAAVAAVGVAIWQSEKTTDQVTIRITRP